MNIKRYAVAAAAAGVVFTGVYGAAASLAVDGGAVQAGSNGSLRCDTDGVTVASYTSEPGDDIETMSSRVSIDGISAACEGYTLYVRVSDSGGTLLARGFKVLPDDPDDTGDFGRTIVAYNIGSTTSVPAADIDKVSISIS